MSPWFASLHSCAAALEDEDATHFEILETLEGLSRGGSWPSTAPFNRF